MENLADILQRLNAATRERENGFSHHAASDSPAPPADERDDNACQVCGGRGWYTPDVVVGHADFGQVIPCNCQQQRLSDERLDRLLRYSNLGHLSRFRFGTLNPDFIQEPDDRRTFEDACRIAVQYAENPKGWLTLVGPNGSGKTHIAASIANYCIESEQVVFFIHVPDLLDHLRATYAPTSALTYSDLYTQVVEAPLLILDGLGAHSSTPWAEEKLQQIMNHRFNAELPTVITTATELAELDPYTRSRIEAKGLSIIVRTRNPQSMIEPEFGKISRKMLDRMTFQNFEVRGGTNAVNDHQESLKNALRKAQEYANNPQKWLTLFGGTGVGKTHLAVSIANECLKKEMPVFFAFVPDLMDDLRSAFSKNSPLSYDRLFSEVKDSPILILDDLGKERPSPWAEEKLLQIIVHRHNIRLPTIITSQQIYTDSTESGSIISRVCDKSIAELVHLNAVDYRAPESRAKARMPAENRVDEGRYLKGDG